MFRVTFAWFGVFIHKSGAKTTIPELSPYPDLGGDATVLINVSVEIVSSQFSIPESVEIRYQQLHLR